MKLLLPKTIIVCGLLAAVTSAHGQTWTQSTAPSNDWWSVASSADGTILATVEEHGNIYVSTNSGGIWTQTSAPNENWYSIASSANGAQLTAAAFNGIYISTNSGSTWTQTSAPSENYQTITSSADGTILAAGVYNGGIYISTNSGSTWTQTSAPDENWFSITSSADGTKLAAAANSTSSSPFPPGSIYTSTDFGTTWTAHGPARNWESIASSADGNKLAAVASNSGIYTTTNSGRTWTQTSAPNGNWWSIASSADGNKLVAVEYSGRISSTNVPFTSVYCSTNSGSTWTHTIATNEFWIFVASSADGNALVATLYHSIIYISKMIPLPLLNIFSSDTNLTVSWLIPSTNFVLQRNLDLTTTNWVTLTTTSVLNLSNLQDQVIFSPTNTSGYFRLLAQ